MNDSAPGNQSSAAVPDKKAFQSPRLKPGWWAPIIAAVVSWMIHQGFGLETEHGGLPMASKDLSRQLWLIAAFVGMAYLVLRHSPQGDAGARHWGLSTGTGSWISLIAVGICTAAMLLWSDFTLGTEMVMMAVCRVLTILMIEMFMRSFMFAFCLPRFENRKWGLAVSALVSSLLVFVSILSISPYSILVTALYVVAGTLVFMATRSIMLVAVVDTWLCWPSGMDGGQLLAPILIVVLYYVLVFVSGWYERRRRRLATSG